MREVIIAGNWKMYKTREESEALIRLLLSLPAREGRSIVVFPAMPNVSAVVDAVRDAGSSIYVGAQNCHWELEGAQTGESSVLMLRAIGC